MWCSRYQLYVAASWLWHLCKQVSQLKMNAPQHCNLPMLYHNIITSRPHTHVDRSMRHRTRHRKTWQHFRNIYESIICTGVILLAELWRHSAQRKYGFVECRCSHSFIGGVDRLVRHKFKIETRNPCFAIMCKACALTRCTFAKCARCEFVDGRKSENCHWFSALWANTS